jgi:hypothetical protein
MMGCILYTSFSAPKEYLPAIQPWYLSRRVNPIVPLEVGWRCAGDCRHYLIGGACSSTYASLILPTAIGRYCTACCIYPSSTYRRSSLHDDTLTLQSPLETNTAIPSRIHDPSKDLGGSPLPFPLLWFQLSQRQHIHFSRLLPRSIHLTTFLSLHAVAAVESSLRRFVLLETVLLQPFLRICCDPSAWRKITQ